MARTTLTSKEISGIQRNDLDITTSGEAVVRKLVAGTNISFSSTGVDAGTGDVTINASGGGGSLTIGSSPIISGTANRVLYENSSNVLTESANLTFDASTLSLIGQMTIGSPTAASVGNNQLTISRTGTTTGLIGANITVNQEATSGSVNAQGILVNVKHNYAGSNSQAFTAGNFSSSNITGSTTGTLIGISASATNLATTSTLRGMNMSASSTGLVTTGEVFKSAYIQSGATTSSTLIVIDRKNFTLATTGASVTELRGLSFDTYSAPAGTVLSSNYLIYADTSTNVGTSKFGLYFLPDMPSYHVGKLGLGTGTSSPSARLHVRDAGEQARFGYDASNYLSVLVDGTDAILSYTTLGTGGVKFNNNLASTGYKLDLAQGGIGSISSNASAIILGDAYGNNNSTTLEINDNNQEIVSNAPLFVPTETYGASWYINNTVPTKADLYTKIESLFQQSLRMDNIFKY